MKRLFIIMLILMQYMLVSAQKQENDLKISVLTCAHGEQIYASFGHCAFRVVSPSRNIDKVYNYGTFNYKQPLFVLKFVRGFLDYAVSGYSYSRFLIEYQIEERKVTEQVLNLSDEQAQAMYDFLEWNALEENRYYKYNFLEDNCATRIRDVIVNTCGKSVTYPDTLYNFTLRDAIDERIKEMPWFRLGITLLMGLPVDKKATSQTAMFLPDYVYNTLSTTTININGQTLPIVKTDNVVVEADKPVDRTDILTYISPSLIFWIILAIWMWVTYKEIKNNKYHAAADKAMLFIVGLFGILFIIMWFFTEHTVTAWNLNILWAMPTHTIAAWAVRSKSNFWRNYYRITSIITALMLIGAPIIPQHYDPAFYPLMLMLAIRLARIGWK